MNFRQEKLIKHFYIENQNGTHQDISYKIFDFLDPNDQEKLENF